MSNSILALGDDKVFLKGSNSVIVQSRNNTATKNPSAPAGNPGEELKPEYADFSAYPWAQWFFGDDKWPDTAKEFIRNSVMLAPGMERKEKMFYGKGVMTYKSTPDVNGTEQITVVKDPVIEAFFRHTKVEHYIAQSIRDHTRYANVYPRFIFSKDKSKINMIVAEKARQCRWEKIDKVKRKISNCYISAFFGITFPNKENYDVLPVINLFDDPEVIRAQAAKQYIYRAMYPLSDNDYYAEPAWYSAVNSGWVDVEKNIPQFKKYMFENQISIKYHIEIPWDYWEKRYKDWNTPSCSPAEKTQRKTDFYNEVNEFLTGPTKAGITFISEFGYDPIAKKEIPGIKITVLASGNLDDKYLGDVDTANTQISNALSLDRAMSGQASKSMGSGSGSDKLEADRIAKSLLRLDRDFIFQPFNFIRDYNGWDPEIKFGFPDMVLTTMDKNPTGVEKVVN